MTERLDVDALRETALAEEPDNDRARGPIIVNRGRVLGEPVDLAIEQLANIEALTNPPVTS
jgi:hypothetical protein